MAFERLVPGHILDAGDVIFVLKEGEDCGDYALRRAERSLLCRSSYEELIESRMERSARLKETAAANRSLRYDAVEEALDDAEALLLEEREYALREQRTARFAYLAIRAVWDAFYRLDPERQDILRSYYTEGRAVREIAGRLDISETTFWRRRRSGIRAIVESCRAELASQRH